MTNNIVHVGSANIAQLGFLAYFDLDQQALLLDITGQTLFVGAGASAVVGISFNITGPGGLILDKVDFTAPDILPGVTSTFQINLPGIYGMFGFYRIQAQIKDADGTIYSTAEIVKAVTKPEGYNQGFVPGEISLEADCDVPQLLITENTVLSYQDAAPAGITKAGTLSYPRGTLADLDFTETPFLIGGAGFVYTGRYTVSNKTIGLFDIGDGILVKVPYVVIQQEQVVDCNTALVTLICCVESVKEQYDRNPNSVAGKAAKARLDAAAIPFYLAIIKAKSGQDASAEIAEIIKTLNCDCGCGSSIIEPRPMIGAGLSGLNLNVAPLAGNNAAIVSNSTSGSTKTFYILVKNVDVVNSGNDLAFNITKGVSSTQITYGITFNYGVMATAILTAIQNDDDLTALIKQIVASANAGISLSGLNTSCILTIGNCSYTLIEPTTPAKIINSITIAGTVHTAPGSLALTNDTGIAAWLNGLGLGTFTAFFDASTLTTLIETDANPNAVTQLSINIGPATTLRQFTKTCVGLVDFLNAITTYVCDIDTTKIAFGLSGQMISTFAVDGSVVHTMLSPAMLLSNLLAGILAAQADLYNKTVSIALNCANVEALFGISGAAVTDTDYVLGTKGGSCARLSFSEIAAQVLTDIGSSPALQSALCALVANCSAPTCSAVTNPSASLSGGTLTVNCNNASPSTSILVGYRVYNSGSSFTQVVTSAGALPLAITSLSGLQYEVTIQKLCSNGQYSPLATALSQPCAVPASFTVVSSGTQFVVTGTLAAGQTIIEVQMTDPTGGVSTFIHDFGAVSGTFNIPYVTGVYGNYTFIARGVCNNTSTPRFVSAYLAPVVVNYPNPLANNFKESASYTMCFSDLSNGTATGVPTSFNGLANCANHLDTCPSLSAGTIIATLTGTIPAGPSISLNLVLNGTTILDTHVITGPGPITLNNPAPISYPNNISVEIDLT